LNIGGKKFTLSKRLITDSFKDSYFNKLLEGKVPIVKDKDDSCFIDRNGELFPYVVDFLYNKRNFIKKENPELRKRIFKEL